MVKTKSKKSALLNFDKMSDEEIAKFWETHDSASYMEGLEEAKFKIKRPKLRQVSIRFNPTDLKLLKSLARRKRIGYQTLLRLWVKERLKKEYQKIA